MGPLLARANLMRMRGQWREAADACADVLRLDPRNPTAHSLLGDLAQDQGRPQDALHWYQLALELNPNSVADRAKLARAEEVLEAREQKAEWEAVIEGRRQPVATSLLVRESLHRIIAIAGAAVCGIILVLASLASVSERSTLAEDDSVYPMPARGPRLTAEIPVDTSGERELKRKAAALLGGRLGQIVRVELDGRAATAGIRVFIPRKARERLNTPAFRAAVMREGYRSARAVHEGNHNLTRVDVVVVGPLFTPQGTWETELLLSGTLNAEDLVVDPDAVAVDELERFYRANGPPVWAPELATVARAF